MFDQLPMTSKEQSRQDKLAEIPHAVFKCWIIQNLGNDGQENSKVVDNLDIFLTCRCLTGAKIHLNWASKNMCFYLVMINKNTDSQHKRGLQSNELKKIIKE